MNKAPLPARSAQSPENSRWPKRNHFLDEIAEMSPHLQAKLLHVLQDGQYSRFGARAVVNVDVRVLAATNMDVKVA